MIQVDIDSETSNQTLIVTQENLKTTDYGLPVPNDLDKVAKDFTFYILQESLKEYSMIC